jgi:HK97 family phage portal protein
MRVVPGPDGWPAAYDYAVGAEVVRFVQEGEVPPILHLTLFHPTDDHYGLSPMEAAAVPLDIHNAAGAWNKALLDNAARPSGALVFGSAKLSETQFDRLKAELELSYQGAANAGRPLLLEGGLDWKPLSLSPKDMDFIEAKNAAARDIALAFGVPPLLLGLPGDNTHANYAEANRAFYRQTVIPLAKRTAQALAQWLAPAFVGRAGQGLALEPDLDAVEALSAERESLWRRVTAADFLTPEEKREAVGYGRRGAPGL